MKVLPAINCLDLESVVSTFHRLEKFVPPGTTLHLDVCDAQFTANRTWADPIQWQSLLKHLNIKDVRFEAHLMVDDPEAVLEPWLRAGAVRTIVHVERLKDSAFIHRACEAYKAEAMLSSNPETPITVLEPHAKNWKAFQVLAVNPGLAGQKFLPVVLDKIKFLRSQSPHAIIEVDGGVNLETAMLAKACGANELVSASYVLDAHDPGAALRELQGV